MLSSYIDGDRYDGVIGGSVWRDSKLRRCNADEDVDLVVIVIQAGVSLLDAAVVAN